MRAVSQPITNVGVALQKISKDFQALVQFHNMRFVENQELLMGDRTTRILDGPCIAPVFSTSVGYAV